MAFIDDPDEVGKLAEVDKVGGICPTDYLEDPGPLLPGWSIGRPRSRRTSLVRH